MPVPQIAHANAYPHAHRLTIGATLLRGQYVIRDYLADGGFAQAYLAEDSLGRLVVIKECYPSEICVREGMQVQPLRSDQDMLFRALVVQFVKEARRLAQLAHPRIVKVHQVFEENGTAYMALDHVEGSDLQTLLDHNPERLTPDLVESTLRTALDALGYVHEQGHLHRDIAPDNLMIGPDDTLTVIDFGSARDLSAVPQGRPEMLAVKDGYSPAEFYDRSREHTPTSDLYSLAATMYHLVTRTCPLAADKRAEALKGGQADPLVSLCRGTWGYERKFLGAIDRALSLDPAVRPQSAREWLEMIDGQRDPFDTPMAPSTEPELDPELEARVAELVRTVGLTAGEDPKTPRAAESSRQHPLAPMKTAEPKQLVDMFGTPIADVDAWLREQDRLKACAPQGPTEPSQVEHPTTEEAPDHGPAPEPVPPRSVFSRLFGKRRKSGPIAADD